MNRQLSLILVLLLLSLCLDSCSSSGAKGLPNAAVLRSETLQYKYEASKPFSRQGRFFSRTVEFDYDVGWEKLREYFLQEYGRQGYTELSLPGHTPPPAASSGDEDDVNVSDYVNKLHKDEKQEQKPVDDSFFSKSLMLNHKDGKKRIILMDVSSYRLPGSDSASYRVTFFSK